MKGKRNKKAEEDKTRRALTQWAKKRTDNIYRLIEEMRKDDSRVLEMASTILSDLSDTPWKLGDESGAILLAWIAARLHAWKMDLRSKQKKKRKYLEGWNDRRHKPV